MKTKFKAVLLSLIFIMVLVLAIFYIFSHDIAILYPKGMIGIKERDLIVTASILMLIVVIPVFILTLFFAWKYRENNVEARHEPDWENNRIAEMCWWGVPFVIIVILAILCWHSSHELNPFNPIASEKQAIRVQTVALDWKWLFIYPDQGVAAINVVKFPEHTPIAFEITADAPMNSFWIPELGGMIMAMPAMRSKLHLIANATGTFRGCSSNISGKGFAGMYFNAVATTNGEFESWVSEAKSSGKSLTFETYQNSVLKPSEYAPVELFSLEEHDLFEKILQQYMAPKK